jgi:hypothetical protein
MIFSFFYCSLITFVVVWWWLLLLLCWLSFFVVLLDSSFGCLIVNVVIQLFSYYCSIPLVYCLTFFFVLFGFPFYLLASLVVLFDFS